MAMGPKKFFLATNPGKGFVTYEPTAAPTPTPPPSSRPRVAPLRTQKARGIEALTLAPMYPTPKPVWFVRTPEDIDVMEERERKLRGTCVSIDARFRTLPLFARPCPTRPRHGFVESRLAKTWKQVRDTFAAARAADPEAELVLMKRIDADCSAIYTPGLLTLGAGHDGATAGKRAHVVALGGAPISSLLLERARVTGSPYLEIVATCGLHEAKQAQAWAVQLRDGPPVPVALDYIPASMRVAHVVPVEAPLPSLEEWEARVPTFAPRTVVVLREGGLSSHVAVHCILHRVPVITTRTPLVGEVLAPVGASEGFDMDGVRLGLSMASLAGAAPYVDAVRVSLLVLHNLAHLPKLPAGSILVGAALGFTTRLAMAATLGESRHALGGHVACLDDKIAEKLRATLGAIGESRGDRNLVYRQAWKDPVKAFDAIQPAFQAFDKGRWGGSFGGQAWARCAKVTMAFLNTVRALSLGSPPAGALTEALDAFNRVLNCAHNNGWWFNKFVQAHEFAEAANGAVSFVVKAVPAVYATLESAATHHVTTPLPFAAFKVLHVPPTIPPAELVILAAHASFSGTNGNRALVHVQYLTQEHMADPTDPYATGLFGGPWGAYARCDLLVSAGVGDRLRHRAMNHDGTVGSLAMSERQYVPCIVKGSELSFLFQGKEYALGSIPALLDGDAIAQSKWEHNIASWDEVFKMNAEKADAKLAGAAASQEVEESDEPMPKGPGNPCGNHDCDECYPKDSDDDSDDDGDPE